MIFIEQKKYATPNIYKTCAFKNFAKNVNPGCLAEFIFESPIEHGV